MKEPSLMAINRWEAATREISSGAAPSVDRAAGR